MRKSKVIMGVMAMAMVAALTACGTKAKTETTTANAANSSEITGDGVATKGQLVMVTNLEFPPFEYRENDQPTGIDVDIAKEVAKKMGLELKVDDIAFDSIIPELVSGKADISFAGMTVTEDRKQSVDFTQTYAKASQMIIVKNDSSIAGPDDLKNKRIGVQQGTTGDLFSSTVEGATVERYNKGMEAVQALVQGKVDAVVIDEQPAKVYVKEVQGTKVLDAVAKQDTEEYAAAVKKGNTALLNNVNKALDQMKADGTIDQIIAKYTAQQFWEGKKMWQDFVSKFTLNFIKEDRWKFILRGLGVTIEI